MKKLIILILIGGFALSAYSQKQWEIVAGKIQTAWANQVNPEKPLPEYPRPQMVRANWINLNGLWQYAVKPKSDMSQLPSQFSGQILVPFAIESALSGVGKTVGKDSVLWYERIFSLPKNFNKNKLLLHFGAVDWQAEVYVNGKKAGSHEGGYDPFTFDISGLIHKSGEQKITVRVWDPTDAGPQPRGKQVKDPEGIWYTPVTGIWQTVWLEAVPDSYISATRQTPDLSTKTISVAAEMVNRQPGDQLKVTVWKGEEKIAEKAVEADQTAIAAIPDPVIWSPSSPFLYDLKISLVRNGKTIDEVKSYFALRKISLAPDAAGVQRLMLNDRFLFQFGPLDQGWWPDGLYTAPTDEALKFDIVKTKEMGFNMIRKHVKVEPARWYYYCDSIGMLVWQDMPSGDLGNRWDSRPGIIGIATDKERTQQSENIYRTEWKEIIGDFYNFPSIVVWTPFNEAWGQFKTKEIVELTHQLDSTRLINTASGGNFVETGDIIDLHNYPDPAMPRADLFGRERAVVLGEFGGLGLPVKGHTWQDEKNWGYQTFKNPDELFKRYADLINRIPDLIKKGLSAAVYTQTTDVEVEVNGLMTYDRAEIKMPVERLQSLHRPLYDPKLAVMLDNQR